MIDIIIPVYKAKKTIKKTLYSIANQYFVKNFHVYLVIDADDYFYGSNAIFNMYKKISYYK